MTPTEAETVKHGDKVHAFNGPYCQRGIVQGKERDKGGMWIKFTWRNASGDLVTTRKRAKSVHVGWVAE